MENIFVRIYQYFEKHRGVYFVTFISLFALSAFFALRLRFEEDISKVLPRDKKIEKLNQVFQNSKFLDRMVVMITQKDSSAPARPDSLVEYADHFVEALRLRSDPYILKISDKVNDSFTLALFNTIREHLPVYLDDQDYLAMDTLTRPDRLGVALRGDIRTLTSPAGLALKNMISSDPVGISYLGLKKMQQLQYDDNFELYDNYVVTRDHKHLLLFITPRYPPGNTGMNARLLKGLDATGEALAEKGYGSIEMAYFGATAVSVGNALQLRKDSLYTQGITVVFLIVLIGLYFRKKTAPLIILVPVLFGALFSLAAIYFIKGSISVIALGSGSVILGVAVNYSLHVFNHYKHTGSIIQVIRDLVMPLTVGSFTTIGGFLCLEFVESEMLRDLGLFAAFSLIGASLCSLIFLPHIIASRKEQLHHQAIRNSWIDSISSYRPEYNKYIVITIIGLTFVFAYTARSVGFESELVKMNFMSDRLRQAETRLNSINAFSLQSVYLVSEGASLNEALVNNEKAVARAALLKSRGIVRKYSGVSSLIISDSLQRARITRWKKYWTDERKKALLENLVIQGTALGFRPSAFDAFSKWLTMEFQPADNNALAGVRKTFLDDYITEKPGNTTVVTLLKVSPGGKKAVYDAFENDQATTVLDKQYLTTKFVEIINSDFTSIALMSSILVFGVLLLTYGRLELTLISFIPMFITFIWILGIMGLFGIQFNIINIIISAFIFGLGDDYSLFIMDGLLQEYKTGKKNLSSYKSSIFLSAITTIAGLGVLIFAKHPALRSIAIISIVGIFCVVIMSQILIPFLFRVLITRRVERKRFPWTISGLLKSAFAFTYFVLASLLLTLIGVILVRLNPFNRETGKLAFHRCVAAFCWSLMYVMGNVSKKVINPLGEDFSKPAIVISNHQSFLDILSTVMLHPRLILFTNHWVWNSPVFGFIVRMADYYPVMQGAEGSLDLVADRIRKGYSVIVFPEGTRSVDGKMRRFHKGAFFLAEKFQLDILPIVIHGTGYTMTKNDFLLKDGRITLKFLPRISPSDLTFGEGYAERSKLVGRYFRKELDGMRQTIEQPGYYREQLIYNYLYKGPVLEWYLRIKIRMENDYQVFHDLLPKTGKILDIGCGYGFMSYMLHFAAPARHITGIDYDEDKIETALHCFSRNRQTNFICSDIVHFPLEPADGIVVSDVLHYLTPPQQRMVIEKCIESIHPEGVLVIRDANKDLALRHRGTRFTEFISTTFSGFNKTANQGLSFLSGNFIRSMAAEHRMDCQEIDQTKYTSNVIFVLKKKPGTSHAAV